MPMANLKRISRRTYPIEGISFGCMTGVRPVHRVRNLGIFGLGINIALIQAGGTGISGNLNRLRWGSMTSCGRRHWVCFPNAGWFALRLLPHECCRNYSMLGDISSNNGL